MSNIVIDGRMINESGIGRYLRNLIFHLQKLDKRNEYYILHLRSDYDSLVYHTKSFHKVLADFRWYTVTEQIELPGILNRIKPDLVHFPHFNVPVFYRGKFLVTIHDLIHQHYQMRGATTHAPVTYKLKYLGYKTVFRKAVNNSLKIITPSEYVKKQLIDEWNVEDGKIVVTPEAVDDNLLSIENKMGNKKIARVMEKFGVRHPYIFYVGNAHPHKNVEGLIKVLIKLIRHPGSHEMADKQSLLSGESRIYSNKDSIAPPMAGLQNDTGRLQLVLSGANNYFWKNIREKYALGNIVYTGFVNDKELVVLYKNAQCFVLPSFEEGFGIPILEAMAVGCPVVSSNTASLPEVGGNAALYFDPHNLEDMGNKIDMVFRSETLREKLIKKGMMRVKKFSWKKMAEQTLEVYNQCM